MKILICDDEQSYVDALTESITAYMSEHCINADIYSTTSSTDILNNSATYDLVFLDIQMPDADGISIAKELKERNGKVVIFFVTNFDEYQDEAMDLHAFRFFEKPFNAQRLYASLDKALQYIDESYVDLFLSSNGEQIQILVDNIVYIERANRKITMHTSDGNEYVTKENLDEWMSKLPNTFFYQVHKSFIVNLHFITKNSYTELYLNDTIRVPVASRKQADFHKYWFNYLKRR